MLCHTQCPTSMQEIPYNRRTSLLLVAFSFLYHFKHKHMVDALPHTMSNFSNVQCSNFSVTDIRLSLQPSRSDFTSKTEHMVDASICHTQRPTSMQQHACDGRTSVSPFTLLVLISLLTQNEHDGLSSTLCHHTQCPTSRHSKTFHVTDITVSGSHCNSSTLSWRCVDIRHPHGVRRNEPAASRSNLTVSRNAITPPQKHNYRLFRGFAFDT